MNPVLLAKSTLMSGLAAWMTVAVFNNATDPATNRFFIGAMFEMSLLADDPNGLGRGLHWRATPMTLVSPLLWLIVIVQTGIADFLWKAAILCGMNTMRRHRHLEASVRATAVRALTCFMALWIFFMTGGLWFGYWLKQGAIQQVHMTLLIVSILALLFVASREVEEGTTASDRDLRH